MYLSQKSTVTLIKLFAACVVALIAFLWSAHYAHAVMNASHDVQDGGPVEATGIWTTVSLVGGGPYSPGETVTIRATIGSDDHPRPGSVTIRYRIEGVTGYRDLIVGPVSDAQMIMSYTASDTFSAPSSPGNYTVCMVAGIGNYGTSYGNRCDTFRVEQPAIPPICGTTLDGQSFYNTPNQSLACNAGSRWNWTGGIAGWTWDCYGFDEFGDTGPSAGTPFVSCSADRAYDGQCGTTLDTCAVASPFNTVNNAGPAGDTSTLHRWQCLGSQGGTDTGATQCTLSKNANENGSCGNAINMSFTNAPVGHSDLCTSTGGNSTIVRNGGFWEWTCLGQGTGSDSPMCRGFVSSFSCQGSIPGNATANPGDSNPTSNINWQHGNSVRSCEFSCNSGFTWDGSRCAPDGGTPAACGSAAGGTFAARPTSNLWAPGSTLLGINNFSSGGFWRWSCYVDGSGEPAVQCTAIDPSGPPPPPPPPPTCGAADGVPASSRSEVVSRGQCVGGSANWTWPFIPVSTRDANEVWGPNPWYPRWSSQPTTIVRRDYFDPPRGGDWTWSCGGYGPWGWIESDRCSAPYLDPDPTPDPPAVAATCDVGNIEINFSSSGASTTYNLRIDDESNIWNGSCSSPEAGDTCIDGLATDPYTRTGTIGNDYRVWIEACNGSGDCSADTSVSFSCPASNSIPVVDAGPDIPLALPVSTATVTAATATDGDGPNPLTFNWIYQSGPAVPTITNGTSLGPTFSDMIAGTYQFQLAASDGAGTGFDDMRVTLAAEPTYVLDVNNTGLAGSIGLTTSGDSGILCEGAGLLPPNNDCSEAYIQNSNITLTATIPNGVAEFSGGCVGTNSCVVTMTGAQTVSVDYDCLSGYTWTGSACTTQHDVNLTSTGEAVSVVTITDGGTGINCGSTCFATYNDGEVVTLTAISSDPNADTTFSGDCSGSTCVMTIDSDKTVSAVTSCAAGYTWNSSSGSCESTFIDLTVDRMSISRSGADAINGTYALVNITMVGRNEGTDVVPAGYNIPYRVTMGALDSGLGFYNSAIGAGSDTSSFSRSFTDVAFGDYVITGEINLETVDVLGPLGGESDRTNNTNTMLGTYTVTPPYPQMGITATPVFATPDRDVVIEWNAHTSYDLNCSVVGPEVNVTFNPNDGTADGSGSETRASQTVSISNTSQYILRCEEPVTGTVFEEVAEVEIIPTLEEV